MSNDAAVRRYRELLRADRRDVLRGADEINALGLLIDTASDLGRDYGLTRAIIWAERIVTRPDTADGEKAIVHYFAANAWSSLRHLNRLDEGRIQWEQPESEREIVHLRHAKSVMAETLDPIRQCQVLTNLGNALNSRGRLCEAIAEWDAALTLDPRFAMAHGNRGAGLWWYARVAYDPWHKVHLARAAHAALEQAITDADHLVHPDALREFSALKTKIEGVVPATALAATPEFRPRRAMSDTEKSYRNWCARERLFLNDLNDIGKSEIVMADVLSLPNFVTAFDEGPSLIGFFNQLKQEYITSRWLLYDGTHAEEVHFADRDVTLVNTLDYPSYSVRIEQVKLVFRSAYSLFDKLAFFLNDYLGLGIPERDISFRTLWYDRGGRERGIRPEIRERTNVFLQALFWVSKDFFEQSIPQVADVEPDARRAATIRNELEHKYLKLHEMMVDAVEGRTPEPAHDRDRLAYSMKRSDFEKETRMMLRRARAALMYLAYALQSEEARRSEQRGDTLITMPVVSDVWDDEWKT